MMTAPSTISPKSIAPIDIKFPGTSRMRIMTIANNIASGIVTAITKPARTLPNNKNKTMITNKAPSAKFFSTVLIVVFTIAERS